MSKVRGKAAAIATTAAVCLTGIAIPSASAASNPDEKDCSRLAVVMPGGGQSVSHVDGEYSTSQVKNIANNLRDDGYTVDIAQYDATPFLMNTYPKSVENGKDTTNKAIEDITEGCENPVVGLAGYSQSGDILSQIASEIGNDNGVIDAKQLGGVSLLSTPRQGTEGAYRYGADSKNGILGSLDAGYGDASNKVLEICADGDYICDDSAKAAELSEPFVDDAMNVKAKSFGSILASASRMEVPEPGDVVNVFRGLLQDRQTVKDNVMKHGSGYGEEETKLASDFIEKIRDEVVDTR